MRQRRPIAGATPTCWSGAATCSRSTTARRCTSTTPGRGGISSARSGSRRSRTTSATTSWRHYAAEAAAQDADARRPDHRTRLEDVLAEVPDEWLEPVPGAESPDALRAALRRATCSPASRGPRAWLPGAGRWREAATSTSSCAACRASTARSSSTSGWCSTARPRTSSAPASLVDEERLRGARPRRRRRRGPRTRWLRSSRSAAARRMSTSASVPRHGVRRPRGATTRHPVRLPARPAQHRRTARAGARRAHRRPGSRARSGCWRRWCAEGGPVVRVGAYAAVNGRSRGDAR